MNISASESIKRILFGTVSVAGLIIVYLTQQFDYLQWLFPAATYSESSHFVVNRVVRYILNDLLAILLIWAIFYEVKYVKVAFLIQFLGLFAVLPVYLYFKITFEGAQEISSPLFSFLHRIIINPILILLLIPAFYIQKQK